MSHVLTENTTFDASVTVPDDGDAEVAASVNGALQSVTDRTRYLVHELTLFSQIVQGLFVTPPLIYCPNNTSNIVISDARGLAFAGFQWPGSGASLLIPGVSSTLATLLGGTPAHNTWYYLYADTAGAYHATAAAVPDSTQTFMGLTANVNQRYVGCCLTDNTGQVVPFYRSRGGRYKFRPTGGLSASNFFTALSGGNATGATNVTLASVATGNAPLVPPHVQLADLHFFLQNTDTGADHAAFVGAGGDTLGAPGVIFNLPKSGTGDPSVSDICMEQVTNLSQQIAYKVDNAAMVVRVDVLGFQE